MGNLILKISVEFNDLVEHVKVCARKIDPKFPLKKIFSGTSKHSIHFKNTYTTVNKHFFFVVLNCFFFVCGKEKKRTWLC